MSETRGDNAPEIYLKMKLSKAYSGSMVLPFSSVALVMFIVAIIEAINNQTDESTRFAPGQRLDRGQGNIN